MNGSSGVGNASKPRKGEITRRFALVVVHFDMNRTCILFVTVLFEGETAVHTHFSME